MRNGIEFIHNSIECEGLEWLLVLAFADDQLVGTAAIDGPQHLRPVIQSVCVRADRRRQGIGRALIEACVRQCKQSGKAGISLKVAKANTAAIALYRKVGFRTALEEQAHYWMSIPFNDE